MPTIPTPFIGGSDRPQHDRSDENDLEPPFFSEPAEPEKQAEPGAGAVEPAESEAEPPFFLELEDAEEAAPVQEAAPEPEPEPDFLAPTADEPPHEAHAAPAGSADIELPDYFFGPDTPVPYSSPKGTAAAPPLPESPELLARTAEELLEGAHGDSIRDLVASLGSATAEVAIPRAFAAGYIAAKSGEEK